MVRRDEAGHDDRARAVDDLGIARGYGWSDLGDPLPVDQDVGFFEVAHLRVEAEHDASPEQDVALAAVAGSSPLESGVAEVKSDPQKAVAHFLSRAELLRIGLSPAKPGEVD